MTARLPCEPSLRALAWRNACNLSSDSDPGANCGQVLDGVPQNVCTILQLLGGQHTHSIYLYFSSSSNLDTAVYPRYKKIYKVSKHTLKFCILLLWDAEGARAAQLMASLEINSKYCEACQRQEDCTLFPLSRTLEMDSQKSRTFTPPPSVR